jgi:oxygen-independent coproporphyrinogen-3 oxidase
MIPGLHGDAVRFSTPDSLEGYLAASAPSRTRIPLSEALEETFFLGLRLNSGVNLRQVVAEFGGDMDAVFPETIAELVRTGLIERKEDMIRLTPRGRLLSNEVFEQFISLRAGPVPA